MTDTEHLLQQATYASRLFALENFELQNSCVETTRLLIGTLGKLGIEDARPAAVHVRVFNVAAYHAFEMQLPYEEWPEGAHAMGTDAPIEVQDANPNGWAGHLVVMLRDGEGRRLLDPSADQFNRPGSLNVPGPVAMRIHGIWTPKDPQFRVLADENTIVEYRPLPSKIAKEYDTFPAWVADPEWFDAATDELSKQILSGWSYTLGASI